MPQPKMPTPFWLALLRGAIRRCPACGEGRILKGYLKPVAICTHCSLPVSKYNAEDGPTYFTVLITGLLIVPVMLVSEAFFHPNLWVYESAAVPLALGLTLGLLPVVKGAFIGVLYSLNIRAS